jgi:hypothetical protein
VCDGLVFAARRVRMANAAAQRPPYIHHGRLRSTLSVIGDPLCASGSVLLWFDAAADCRAPAVPGRSAERGPGEGVDDESGEERPWKRLRLGVLTRDGIGVPC